jgi:hypothetical protein
MSEPKGFTSQEGTLKLNFDLLRSHDLAQNRKVRTRSAQAKSCTGRINLDTGH